jgi:hypothetical protein
MKPTPMRYCVECCTNQPQEAFYAGRTARCKACVVARQAADRRLTPRQREFMHILRISPNGIGVAALAALMDLGEQRTAEILRQLRKLGLAAPTADGGPNAAWAPPRVAAVLRTALAERARERNAEREQRRERTRKDAAATAALLAEAPKRVAPHAIKRLVATVPPSVFHLAA